LIIRPTIKLVERLRQLGVTAPIIGFPRGAGAAISDYARQTSVDAIGLDTSVSGAIPLPETMPVQGNLDPQLLVIGGGALERGVMEVKERFALRPHIFNLGHGITPEAMPENVTRLVELVKGGA
jgi:uroporphyrinogen decarboxylase